MKFYFLIFFLLLGAGTIMAQSHVSDLIVTPPFSGGAIKWYTAEGTLIENPGTTVLVNGTTYYASQTVNSVESTARVAVIANLVATTDATSINGVSTGASTVIDGWGSGSVGSIITIYYGAILQGTTTTTVEGGSGGVSWSVTMSSSPPTGTEITARVTGSGMCVSLASNTMTVPVAPTATTPQALCADAMIGDIAVTSINDDVQWYAAATGGEPLDLATVLVNGSTYYASQIVANTESTVRTGVTVTVNSLPTPTFTVQPGATAYTGTDVTYTTESGKSSYVWTFPGTLTTDYTITSGGTSTDNTATLKYITPGSKTVTINYTTNSCTAASATSSTPTTISMLPPGNAMAFDGSADFVNAGNDLSVQIYTGTIEAWIKTSNAGTNFRGIIVKQWAYGIFLNNNVLIAFSWDGTQGISTGIDLADSRWHHVAFCFSSGVDNGSFVYIDGVLKNTFTYVVGNAEDPDPQDVGLVIGNGATNIGDDQTFQGSIDEVRVWNTVRSQTEIQSAIYTELAGNESGLRLNYNFNQGVAGGDNTGITTLFDKTSYANNGTLTNFDQTGTTSNFVESYAMVVPVPAAASDLTSTGFTANWAAPVTGIVSSYKLDVSTSSTFSSFVTGYNGLDCGTSLSQAVSGLTAGTTYYYRVRANKTSLTGSGGYYRTPVTTSTLLAIGDTYQGGKIFYITGTYPNQQGLIAAPSDQTADYWGCQSTPITTYQTNGTGLSNSIAIVEGCNETSFAAKTCRGLSLGGYNDWYLPSLDELTLLYNNRTIVGGFAADVYWSSTQYNTTPIDAYLQNFGTGSIITAQKNTATHLFRAIRSFNNAPL